MDNNNALMEINLAEQALQRADDIGEILLLRDKTAAIQIFANAQGFKEAAQKAKIFQLKAERKAGDWLDINVTHEGGNPQLSQDVTVLPDGITRMESFRWQQQASLPEEEFNEWVDECLAKGWEISASGLRHEAVHYENEQKRAEKAAAGADLPQSDNHWRGEVADISTWRASQQYDFIITDPPYPKEYLPLYSILARRAKEWLKPTGLLIAMCGQSYLNEIYKLMGEHLTYYWTSCYLTPHQPTPLRQKQVNTSWKPLLIYSPSGEYSGKTFGDVYTSPQPDKENHEWEQSEEGMLAIIKQVCLPGQSILDPFCGSGTTGVAALRHGCIFAGIDTDEQAVNISKARLAKWQQNKK